VQVLCVLFVLIKVRYRQVKSSFDDICGLVMQMQ